jgi:hypothetical protein
VLQSYKGRVVFSWTHHDLVVVRSCVLKPTLRPALVMLSIVSLTAFLLLAVSVAGNHIFGRNPSNSVVPIIKKLDTTGLNNIRERDRGRVNHLLARSGAKQSGTQNSEKIGLTNILSYYTVRVGFGRPTAYCRSH